MAMCPVLGYLVIHQDYPTALGLFVVAGVTDLVRYIFKSNYYLILIIFPIFSA